MVRELQHNLLGLPAIRDLEIISGINAVEMNVPDQYPALFNGLGTFKGEYIINLKSNAQPHTKKCADSINPLIARTAIWRFGLITNCGIDRTIVLNFPYASYCPMRLS